MLLLLGVACSKEETAEQATINVLNAVKTLDEDTLSKYMNYNDLVETNEDGNDLESEEHVKKIFENLEYKIVSSEEKENEAIVKVDITNIDMEKVMAETMKSALSEAFSQAFSSMDEQQSEEEYDDMFNEYFNRAIVNNKDSKVINTVDIKLTEVDGKWKIDMDDDLQNALMGNLLSVVKQFEEVKEVFE
jgi:hypothetical protein